MYEYDEFWIYIRDLKENRKKELLEFLGIEKEEDGNYDIIPIATIVKENGKVKEV